PFLASQPVFSHPAEVWRINSRVTGNLDVLDVQTLQFSGIRDIRLDVGGRIVHPLDAKRFGADVVLRNVSGSRDALVALLPKGSLPQNITIPARFDLHGKLNGNLDAMRSDLVLNTSSGTVVLRGFARNFKDSLRAVYDLDLQTKALQLGTILQ